MSTFCTPLPLTGRMLSTLTRTCVKAFTFSRATAMICCWLTLRCSYGSSLTTIEARVTLSPTVVPGVVGGPGERLWEEPRTQHVREGERHPQGDHEGDRHGEAEAADSHP